MASPFSPNTGPFFPESFFFFSVKLARNYYASDYKKSGLIINTNIF